MRNKVSSTRDGGVSVRMEREVPGDEGYEVDVIQSRSGVWRIEPDGVQPEIDYNTEFDALVRRAEDSIASYDPDERSLRLSGMLD